MTKQRNDNNGTAFESWRRANKELESKIGYTATDIDCVWRHWKSNKFMLIEEKNYNANMSDSQEITYSIIHSALKDNPKVPGYCGFHLIQVEQSGPNKGRIKWNGREITEKQLTSIMKFEHIDKLNAQRCFFDFKNENIT